jgi:hypothetical protein
MGHRVTRADGPELSARGAAVVVSSVNLTFRLKPVFHLLAMVAAAPLVQLVRASRDSVHPLRSRVALIVTRRGRLCQSCVFACSFDRA